MSKVKVKPCGTTEDTSAFEATNIKSEISILADEKGQPELTLAAYQLLGPGQGIPFAWDSFRGRTPVGAWANIRHFWRTGATITQLGAQQAATYGTLEAGWELIKDFPAGPHDFFAVFQNGPVTRRHAAAKIFMSLYDVTDPRRPRFVGYRSRDAYPGSQFLALRFPFLPHSKYRLRVGAQSWLTPGFADAYAEVIENDVKVNHYGATIQPLHAKAEIEAEELTTERLLSSAEDVLVRTLSEEEKGAVDWVEHPEE